MNLLFCCYPDLLSGYDFDLFYLFILHFTLDHAIETFRHAICDRLFSKPYLEGTGLKAQRLITLLLLIALAYSSAIVQGTTLTMKTVKKYIFRPQESKRKYARRSTWGSGNDSQYWLTYLDKYSEAIQELMTLTPQKRYFYQQGMRAISHIKSSS